MSEAIDILQRIDINTGTPVSYKETTTWYDGTAISDAKCDGVVYRKKDGKYYVLQYTHGIPIELFGAKGDGVTDDTAAFLAARNYAVRTSQDIGLTNFPVEITFKGKYLITQSPNWAIRNLRLTGIGQAEIICTGSGPVMDLWYYSATNPRTVSGMKVSNLLLTGNANTSSCFAARAISQSIFDNIVCRNANNTTGAGFRLCANVCNVFIKPTVSVNYNDGMVSKPKYGIYFEHDDGPSVIGNTTACQFNMIVMEGVDIGLFSEDISFDINTFNEGTLEGNTTGGLYIGANNRGNTFKNIAFEKNTSYDIDDHGVNTVIEGGYSTNNINFVDTRFCKIQNIRAQTINVDANSVNTKIADLSINNWQGVGYPTGGIFNTSTTTDIVRIRDWGTSDNMYAGYHDRFKYRLATSSGNIVGDTQNEVIEVNATSANLTMTITTSTINAPNTLKIIKNNGTFNVIVTAGAGTVFAPAMSVTVSPSQTIKIISTNNTNTWRLVETTYSGWQQNPNTETGFTTTTRVETQNSSYHIQLNNRTRMSRDAVIYDPFAGAPRGMISFSNQNVFLGSRSAAQLVLNGAAPTNTGNVVIGELAGSALTSGQLNIIFGHSAGTSVTTGSSNILIGFNAQVQQGTSNNLVLGSFIYGNQESGSVRIGIAQNNPQYTLDVSGEARSLASANAFRGIHISNTDGGSSAGSCIRMYNDTGLQMQAFLGSSTNAFGAGAFNFDQLTGDLNFISRTGNINFETAGLGLTNSKLRIFNNGNVGVGTNVTDDATNKLQVDGSIKATQFRLSALNTAPSSATDTGVTGEIRIVNGFIYVCVATNTWQRAAIATW